LWARRRGRGRRRKRRNSFRTRSLRHSQKRRIGGFRVVARIKYSQV
jgi:hypothetical protein